MDNSNAQVKSLKWQISQKNQFLNHVGDLQEKNHT